MQPCLTSYDEPLSRAVATIPPGPWAVGVSGGADSVALLSLLRTRPDLQLHIAHLNHQTRGVESDGDSQFVHQLAVACNLPCTIARLSDLKLDLKTTSNNPSARYRAARMALFQSVVRDEQLQGVILAHHADDHAETILQRLLRGSGPAGLQGIQPRVLLGTLCVLHPLLSIPRDSLRQYLTRHCIAWREDASNRSPRYLRNRLRLALISQLNLRSALVDLGRTCADWTRSLDQAAPILTEAFPASDLIHLPDPLAHHSAKRWLKERGADPTGLSPASVEQLIHMACDAASSPRQHFPGGLLVRRRKGLIDVDIPTSLK